MSACPNCANELAEDAIFCRRCGVEIESMRRAAVSGEDEHRSRPGSRSFLCIPMIVTGLLICLTVAFFDVTAFAVILGFVGFMMFAIGGITYLMGSLQN
jgi:uncharacterized membrane protein YvbJ